MIEVSVDTWWLDSGASKHVANSLQGFITKRPPVSLLSAGVTDGRNFWSFFFWMRGVPPPSPEFGLEWNVNRWMCCASNF
ncbi:unnamed protein product [Prunus armeniaca]